jgi:tetratricopeptide (TPR) repeat protein
LFFLGRSHVARAQSEPRGIQADAVTRAGEHYARGYALVEKEDYAAASAEFELAYAASPNYSVLYNLGHAYAMSGRPVDAVAAFRRYLREGGTNIPPELRERALATIAENERKIGRLHVELRPAVSVEAVVDGTPLPPSAFASEQPLPIGTHGLWLSAPGFRAVQRSFEIHSGQATTIQISLEALPPVPTPQGSQRRLVVKTAAHRGKTRTSARNWSYVLGGGGVALGVAAGIVYATNSASYARWEARRDELASRWGQDDPAKQQAELSSVLTGLSRSQRLDDLSVGLGVGAVMCLGASGYLFWRSYDHEGPSSGLSLTASGVSWSGQW